MDERVFEVVLGDIYLGDGWGLDILQEDRVSCIVNMYS